MTADSLFFVTSLLVCLVIVIGWLTSGWVNDHTFYGTYQRGKERIRKWISLLRRSDT